MARNKVMKLWNAIVTAFLALCTALGLITTTASAAVPQTERTRNSDSAPRTAEPAAPLWAWSLNRALPPTMKQRIRRRGPRQVLPSAATAHLSDAEPDSADCSDDTDVPPSGTRHRPHPAPALRSTAPPEPSSCRRCSPKSWRTCVQHHGTTTSPGRRRPTAPTTHRTAPT